MTLAPVQNPGQFKVYSGGLAWKRQGGGKTIEIDKADVTAVTWMKVPKAYQLGVRIKDGLFYRFIGFREQSFLRVCFDFSVKMNENMLTFMVGSKQAFEVSLADVAQTQMQGKTNILLEFHVDDTTGANEMWKYRTEPMKEQLMEVGEHERFPFIT
ncbi:unnamed protein product [Miscanthus lutarioriparius]|uniref:Uncharacterized protein n=1 Tax=Miscanthus lutarioriparius TaxID=422564 RepID=A0A811NGH6_9POAL|nr:unnamed protein product [Miscanthus lutarioriparius]